MNTEDAENARRTTKEGWKRHGLLPLSHISVPSARRLLSRGLLLRALRASVVFLRSRKLPVSGRWPDDPLIWFAERSRGVRSGIADERIAGGVQALLRARRGQGGPSLEQDSEQSDGIGDVDPAVVVGVRRVLAGERWTALEEPGQDVDRIGDVDAPVPVGVSPSEGM